MEYLWIVWLVVGLAFAVAEAFTLGFFLLWFAIGAFAAGAVALVGGGVVMQVIAFLAVSAALTVASRTIWEHVFFRNRPQVKMGVAALPGQVATVVEPSRGALGEGTVKVFGSTWTAYPAEGEPPLEEGESVTVDRVDGAVLYVKRSRPRGELWRS